MSEAAVWLVIALAEAVVVSLALTGDKIIKRVLKLVDER